jgi:hypothetical protein
MQADSTQNILILRPEVFKALWFIVSFISPFVLCFPSVSNFDLTSQYHQFPLSYAEAAAIVAAAGIATAADAYRSIFSIQADSTQNILILRPEVFRAQSKRQLDRAYGVLLIGVVDIHGSTLHTGSTLKFLLQMAIQVILSRHIENPSEPI